MTIPEFKKIARLLKRVYQDLEDEALKNGISIVSTEFDILKANTRQAILDKFDFSLEEYRQIKAELEQERIAKLDKDNTELLLLQIEERLRQIDSKYIPTDQDIAKIAHDVAQTFIKAPEIINKIVKEVTIQKPQIVKETIIEKTVETVNYNEAPMLEKIAAVDKRVTDLPALPDLESLIKEFFHDNFSKNFEHNIDILGMPDFRKLAMGLQGQIDALSSSGTGGGHTIQDEGVSLTQRTILNFVGAGVSATDSGGKTVVTINGGGAGTGYQAATGTVDGSNTVFSFTSAPSAVSVDGVLLQKTASDGTVNWTGTTSITLSVAPTFDIFAIG